MKALKLPKWALGLLEGALMRGLDQIGSGWKTTLGALVFAAILAARQLFPDRISDELTQTLMVAAGSWFGLGLWHKRKSEQRIVGEWVLGITSEVLNKQEQDATERLKTITYAKDGRR